VRRDEAGLEDGEEAPADPCGGDCAAGRYTSCTCAPYDPCGWVGDGFCQDPSCETVRPGNHFDDGADCAAPPPCDGACASRTYSACTCGPDDPCGWAGNGTCDDRCDIVAPGSHFDDSADCGAPPVCDGDCDARRYTTCSCGTDDPCGWAGNGTCDDACGGVAGADFDDSADCDTPTDLTYIVTAVYDGLDQGDQEIAGRGLERLGYEELAHNDDVSSSEISGYLRRSDLTTLYHTGHGFEGGIMTSGYDSFTLDMADISARHTVFATCLTLAYSWSSAMGSSAQTVAGYTDISYDYVDDEVANIWLDALGADRSYTYAWYQANADMDGLYDRWAIYTREGGSIVEYSARTGRRPSSDPLPATWVELLPGSDVWATAEVLEDARTFRESFAAVPIAEAGERLAEVDPAEFGLLGATDLAPAEAEAAARAWLDERGGLPPDAVLDAVVPVMRRTGESDPGAVVGYMVRYAREIDGLRVRSNLIADHLVVLVGPTTVVAGSRYWPDVRAGSDDESTELLVPVGDAARVAAGSIARAAKGARVRITGAVPVWATAGPRDGAGPLVPGYALLTVRGPAVIVDASTGEPVL
jgi:hypothetical protein